jgi:predicted lysophospholipase L1 biosynthesis ABC-type transport system permease subunit
MPAWQAARADPMDAIRPTVVAARRSMRRPGPFRLAVSGVWRVPTRAVLGVSALAVAIAASTLMASIATVFQGQVTGTLLGDAVTVQVRTADVVATVAMLVLSTVTVADVLYLNVRDRLAEFAVLSATGWTDAMIARLTAVEAAIIGLLGGVCGVLIGGAAALALAGSEWWGRLLPLAAVLVVAGLALAVIASSAPIRVLRHRPITPLLASE